MAEEAAIKKLQTKLFGLAGASEEARDTVRKHIQKIRDLKAKIEELEEEIKDLASIEAVGAGLLLGSEMVELQKGTLNTYQKNLNKSKANLKKLVNNASKRRTRRTRRMLKVES
jgi:uncharacterized protein YydD (DUF2326 family)